MNITKKTTQNINTKNTAAILLVGGYSSRMQTLKALLPFSKKHSLITHCIALFRKVGIEQIYVVLGYEHARIEEHILMWEHKQKIEKICKIVFNPNFDTGMYSSVCAGIFALLENNSQPTSKKIDASFLLPVDAALLQTKTITSMLEKGVHENSILIPTFLDKCGHPPLISSAHFAPILAYEKTFQDNDTRYSKLGEPSSCLSSLIGFADKRNSFFANTRWVAASQIHRKRSYPPFGSPCLVNFCQQSLQKLPNKGDWGKLFPPKKEKKLHSKDVISKREKKFRGLQGYFAQFLSKEEQNFFLKGIAPKNYFASSHTIESKEKIVFHPFADEGILCDIDTPEEYENAQYFLSLTENRKHLSLLEAWHILTHNFLTDRIIRHSYKVGLGAFRLYAKLQEKYDIDETDLLRCFCGGLLHDICRLEKHHAEVGGAYIASLGYKKIASIIEAHTNLPRKIVQEINMFLADFSPATQLDAKSILQKADTKVFESAKRTLQPIIKKNSLPILCVHLADKFYAGEEFVGMQQRFQYIKDRFANDENALKAIKVREEIALKTAYWFFCETNMIAEECVELANNHIFEYMIKSEYEKLIEACIK